MDQENGPLGVDGLVENRHGDTYMRSFWGVVIDKHNGRNTGDVNYVNGFNGPQAAGNLNTLPGIFAIRSRVPSPNGNNQIIYNTDFFINQAGNTGIGTSQPNVNVRLTVNGAAQATVYNVGSDSRFKKDIKQIENALSLVNRMAGHTYLFDQDKHSDRNLPKGLSAGFIAQELESVFPIAVTTGSDGYKYVNYDAVIPVLTEAIKEQKTIVENQVKVIEDQKLAIDSQSKTIIDLAAKLNLLQSKVETFLLGQTYLDSPNRIEVKSFALQPNPTSGQTTVRYETSASEAQGIEVMVFNMNGALVKKLAGLTPQKGEVTLDTAILSAGTYHCSISCGGQIIATKTLLIQK
jgi:Chaperone of endosialidase/Secretion system C-terminal sorting domain